MRGWIWVDQAELGLTLITEDISEHGGAQMALSVEDATLGHATVCVCVYVFL